VGESLLLEFEFELSEASLEVGDDPGLVDAALLVEDQFVVERIEPVLQLVDLVLQLLRVAAGRQQLQGVLVQLRLQTAVPGGHFSQLRTQSRVLGVEVRLGGLGGVQTLLQSFNLSI
jgi:hypothetical protein